MPRRKRRLRNPFKSIIYALRVWLYRLLTKPKPNKPRKRRKLQWQVYVVLIFILCVLTAIFLPIYAQNQKLKKLGYDKATITVIRKEKLVDTLLEKGWYTPYLAQSMKDGNFHKEYLQLYTAVTPSNSDTINVLEDLDFLIYARLLDKGYTVDQCVNLFSKLKQFELIPLLVFDLQYDETAYIEDCINHRETNNQDNFELSGSYYSYYQNPIPITNPTAINTLVNKTYQFSDSYVPNLVDIDARYSAPNRQLVPQAAESLLKMCLKGAEVGVTFYAASAYRSYQDQETIYNGYVSAKGQAYADAYSVKPGFSEHQSGLAVDLAATNEPDGTEFKDTKAYTWLSSNSYDYGWILRYPQGKTQITGYDYEAWHYRYVGSSLAKKIQESKLTYDEYYALYIAPFQNDENKPSNNILIKTRFEGVSASPTPATN